MIADVSEPLRLPPSEAAKLLRCSVKTIWAYVETGQLVPIAPHGRGPGKRVYFDTEEIKAFARKGPKGAAAYRRKRDAQT